MKRLLSFLLLMWISVNGGILPRGQLAKVANPCAAYLICQNFETPTTGYDNGETWTAGAGSPNPVYTTTVLLGSQSLNLASGGLVIAQSVYSGQTDVWLFALFQINSFSSAESDPSVIRFQDNPITQNTLWLGMNSGGGIFIGERGNTSGFSSMTLATGTKYYVWLHYVSGGTSELFVSATSTRPTSDSGTTCYKTISTPATNPAANVSLNNGNNTTKGDFIFDHILVSTTAIGNNP